MPNLKHCTHTVEEGFTNPGCQVAVEQQLCIIFLGPQQANCFMAPFWRPDFCGGS